MDTHLPSPIAPEAKTSPSYLQAQEDAVLYKICRVFEISKEDAVQPEALRAQFARRIPRAQKEKWITRRDECMQHSNATIPAEDIDRLKEKFMMRYADGFYLRNLIFAKYSELDPHTYYGSFFQDHGDHLIDLYLNHVTRSAHYALRNLGFSEHDALKLNGFMIGAACAICKKMAPEFYEVSIRPEGLKYATDMEARTAISEINAFGPATTRYLEETFAKQFPPCRQTER